ncbi:MAG: lysine--tRNA ligase, partial [Anaerolineales bacterium]|nr:lysine--tRNA ligase [Anaerolineales bacterium]
MSWEPNRLEENRLEKLARLREAGIEPYPLRSGRTHTVAAAVDLFEKLETSTPEGEAIPQETVTVTGRLVSFRDMGKSVFGHIEDGTGRIQLFARREEVGEEAHLQLRKLTDLGDFVEVTGYLVRTRTGEISVRASGWRMLAKALSPLPVIKEEQDEDGNTVRHGGFSDVEERYRQRYADLAVNPEVRETFRIRARMISALRRYMDDHDFLEVETPVLQPIYGGAAARPFTTYHNQLKQELYLRIS